MSITFSFGTYRTTYKDTHHKEALNYALDNGITDIDTASNYMNGEAETLIGEAIENRKREDINIVSKGGYIYGDDLQKIADGLKIDDLVIYNETCFHSIDPIFLKGQIENSIKRMNSSYIDIYLLHNPEYYLMQNIHFDSSEDEIKQHREIMQSRIKKAFEFLESEVKKGTIKGYGISSDSFAKSSDNIHFLDYTHLIEYAKEFGGEDHGFKVIQFPMNPFEVEGEAAGIWAKQNGIEVQVNRPLNAISGEEMLRLASYESYKEFDDLVEQMETIPDSEMQKLLGLILDAKHNFAWAGQVDEHIDNETIPFIMNIVKVDQKYHELIYKFMRCYKQEVKHHLSKTTALRLHMEGSIDKQAIEFLKQKEYISKILIGMRDKEYVDRVLYSYNM